MLIESISVDELNPPKQNVRRHPEAQLKELCRAVKMFGQTRPAVIDEDNTVLIGNGLVEALKRLEIYTIHAYRISGLTYEQKQKLMLSDNKIFDLGVDDYNSISEILNGISDFNVPGFDEKFLSEMMEGIDKLTSQHVATFGIVSEGDAEGARARNIPSGSNSPIISKEQNASIAGKNVVCPRCGEVINLDAD